MREHFTKDEAYDFLIEAQKHRQMALDTGDMVDRIDAAKDCGIGHFYMGDYGLAIRLFGEAEKFIHETGEHRELLPTVNGMTGRALQRTKHWEDAIECYRQAAATAKELDLTLQHLRWRGKEAKTLIDLRQANKGVPKLEKSVEYGRTLVTYGDQEVIGELTGQLGSLATFYEETDQTRADKLWDEIFNHLECLPPSRRHYLAATNYSMTLHKQGRDHQAQTYLEEALEIGKQVGADRNELLNVAHRLSEILAKLYGFKTAGDWLMAQRSFFREKQREVLSHAVDLYERGFFWAEMKHAIIEWRKTPVPAPIYAPLFEMTLLYSFACRGVREFDDALAALNEAKEYAEIIDDPECLKTVRMQTVLVLVDRGDFQEATIFARELWDEGIHEPLLARAFLDALIGIREINKAAEIKEQFTRGGGGELDAAWMTGRLADAGIGAPQKAWYEYGMVSHEQRHTACELESLDRLIEIYRPHSEEIFEASRQRLRLFDKVRSNVNDIFSDSAWFSVESRAENLPAYLDSFLETAVAMDRDEEAIYELERFRSQMLVDLMSERSVRWQANRHERIEERSFVSDQYDRARYRYLGLVANGASWKSRREAAERLDRMEKEKAGAGGVIHVAPGWQGLHFPQNIETFFADLKLNSEEALLVQHTFAQQTVCWLMEPNGQIRRKVFHEFSADVLTKLNKKFQDYHTGTVRGSRDLGAEGIRVSGKEILYDLERSFVQPLANWLTTFAIERVFLVAGTAAAIFPLYACPSFVGAGIELAVLPTSRALRFTREQRSTPVELFPTSDVFGGYFERARDRVVVVMDPTQSLRFASWEAGMVGLAIGERKMEFFDNDNVDQWHLCNAARITDVLHLIVHGTFDNSSPYRSGVYIKSQKHENSIWTIADIFSGVDAPAGRLAVLSGCETGLTKPNVVSEEVSLPSSLIAAGFAAVIATKWSVDDLSTALLMGEFYRHWYGGGVTVCKALSVSAQWLRDLERMEAIEAVRGREQRLIEELPARGAGYWRNTISEVVKALEAGPEKPFESPYYWAAFFVAGDGAITADGVDLRDPSTAASLSGH